jgi:hypothetical protein
VNENFLDISREISILGFAGAARRLQDAGRSRFIISQAVMGECVMTKSVLDAIREGIWDFEPEEVDTQSFDATRAIPGTREKLNVLAERVRAGLPLWHEKDRPDYEEPVE